MQSQRSTTVKDAAIQIIAMQHIRTMLSYYLMRELVDQNGSIMKDERDAIKVSATEARRFGFRLEVIATPLDIHLENYNEDRLRREAARINQLFRTSPQQAYEATERLVEDLVLDLLSQQESQTEVAEAA